VDVRARILPHVTALGDKSGNILIVRKTDIDCGDASPYPSNESLVRVFPRSAARRLQSVRRHKEFDDPVGSRNAGIDRSAVATKRCPRFLGNEPCAARPIPISPCKRALEQRSRPPIHSIRYWPPTQGRIGYRTLGTSAERFRLIDPSESDQHETGMGNCQTREIWFCPDLRSIIVRRRHDGRAVLNITGSRTEAKRRVLQSTSSSTVEVYSTAATNGYFIADGPLGPDGRGPLTHSHSQALIESTFR
jgi:hypothetical protein